MTFPNLIAPLSDLTQNAQAAQGRLEPNHLRTIKITSHDPEVDQARNEASLARFGVFQASLDESTTKETTNTTSNFKAPIRDQLPEQLASMSEQIISPLIMPKKTRASPNNRKTGALSSISVKEEIVEESDIPAAVAKKRGRQVRTTKAKGDKNGDAAAEEDTSTAAPKATRGGSRGGGRGRGVGRGSRGGRGGGRGGATAAAAVLPEEPETPTNVEQYLFPQKTRNSAQKPRGRPVSNSSIDCAGDFVNNQFLPADANDAYTLTQVYEAAEFVFGSEHRSSILVMIDHLRNVCEPCLKGAVVSTPSNQGQVQDSSNPQDQLDFLKRAADIMYPVPKLDIDWDLDLANMMPLQHQPVFLPQGMQSTMPSDPFGSLADEHVGQGQQIHNPLPEAAQVIRQPNQAPAFKTPGLPTSVSFDPFQSGNFYISLPGNSTTSLSLYPDYMQSNNGSFAMAAQSDQPQLDLTDLPTPTATLDSKANTWPQTNSAMDQTNNTAAAPSGRKMWNGGPTPGSVSSNSDGTFVVHGQTPAQNQIGVSPMVQDIQKRTGSSFNPEAAEFKFQGPNNAAFSQGQFMGQAQQMPFASVNAYPMMQSRNSSGGSPQGMGNPYYNQAPSMMQMGGQNDLNMMMMGKYPNNFGQPQQGNQGMMGQNNFAQFNRHNSAPDQGFGSDPFVSNTFTPSMQPGFLPQQNRFQQQQMPGQFQTQPGNYQPQQQQFGSFGSQGGNAWILAQEAAMRRAYMPNSPTPQPVYPGLGQAPGGPNSSFGGMGGARSNSFGQGQMGVMGNSMGNMGNYQMGGMGAASRMASDQAHPHPQANQPNFVQRSSNASFGHQGSSAGYQARGGLRGAAPSFSNQGSDDTAKPAEGQGQSGGLKGGAAPFVQQKPVDKPAEAQGQQPQVNCQQDDTQQAQEQQPQLSHAQLDGAQDGQSLPPA